MFEIFIVEDEEQVRDALSELLGGLDSVVVAGSAATEMDAINWLVASEGRWDLAIVDLTLDQGSGLRVLSACRVRLPRQKMVVLSGHVTGEVRRRCVTLGADATFEKGQDMQAMLNYVRAASQSR